MIITLGLNQIRYGTCGVCKFKTVLYSANMLCASDGKWHNPAVNVANKNMQYSVSLAATAAPVDHFTVIVDAMGMEDPGLTKLNTPMS